MELRDKKLVKAIEKLEATDIKDVEPRWRPLFKYLRYICSGGNPSNY